MLVLAPSQSGRRLAWKSWSYELWFKQKASAKWKMPVKLESSYKPIQISKAYLSALSNGGLKRDWESIDQSKLAPMAVANQNQGRQSAWDCFQRLSLGWELLVSAPTSSSELRLLPTAVHGWLQLARWASTLEKPIQPCCDGCQTVGGMKQRRRKNERERQLWPEVICSSPSWITLQHEPYCAARARYWQWCPLTEREVYKDTSQIWKHQKKGQLYQGLMFFAQKCRSNVIGAKYARICLCKFVKIL